MRKEYYAPADAYSTQKRAYSKAVVTEGGRTIWLAGQLAQEPGDFEAQVREIFQKLGDTIRAAGGSGLHDMVTMTVFIKDARLGDRFVELRREIFEGRDFPASALITVTAFARPDTLIEIQGVAVVAEQVPDPQRYATPVAGLHFRFATREDVPVILGLIRELAEFERLADHVVATDASLAEGLFGERRVVEVVLAEMKGEAVGFAVFFHNFSTFLGRAGLYLEDLYVKPHARGLGVGRWLIAFVAKIAVDRKCGRFEWSVLDWNTHALDFYRALGAVAMDEWTVQRVTGAALTRLGSHEFPCE